MGPELVRNADTLEHLLGLSGDDRESVGPKFRTGGEAEAGDGVHQFLSAVNDRGTSLDTLPR